jgi:hypothetical protein
VFLHDVAPPIESSRLTRAWSRMGQYVARSFSQEFWTQQKRDHEAPAPIA